jgi:hypothetical protein
MAQAVMMQGVEFHHGRATHNFARDSGLVPFANLPSLKLCVHVCLCFNPPQHDHGSPKVNVQVCGSAFRAAQTHTHTHTWTPDNLDDETLVLLEVLHVYSGGAAVVAGLEEDVLRWRRRFANVELTRR